MRTPTIERITELLKGRSYTERAAGEYWLVKTKYERLHRMIIKREAGTLDFEPDCPMEQWKAQAAAMGGYLYQLEIKAEYEDMDFDDLLTIPPCPAEDDAAEQAIPCAPGERFTWKGRTYVALGMEQGGMLAITEKPVFEEEPFDEDGSNDWRKSSLRHKLNGMFLDEIGKESLLPFTSDLTSDDGLKDYGTAEDYVFLLSADLYRKYRPYIPNQKTWWWLITPWSTLPSNASSVRFSGTDGSLSGRNAYYTNGVVAGLLFNPESIQLGKEVLRQQHGA